ncbi:hypothetical protein T12_12974 [Trichinella patagoniensis]|uniref:Uncharacterized protein n=1 Tax=Trichinella patagoniensis TaxID=990121 RepID=A0A0V0XEI8_9BILA|nr:hypothetical protein T12_12974 [Trichinella patagoniensis]
MPSSYAQGVLLHNICPQGSYASGKIFKNFEFFKI